MMPGDFGPDFGPDFSGGGQQPNPNPFPPSGPTTLTAIIPSYLYQQYADDDNLQAFVQAWNAYAQTYLTWFAYGQLANYTVQVGPLLDWVGTWLYGVPRPSLSSQVTLDLGPFNTYQINGLAIDDWKVQEPQNITAVSDDIYKRVITWNFYKGDGNVFSVPWLKRRVVQFLEGVDGVAISTADTQQVSVAIAGSTWTITLLTGFRDVDAGPFNTFQINSMAINGDTSTFTPVTPIPDGELLAEAMDAGILVVPFQYDVVVNVG
jgi:hypothetical protein